MANGHAVKRHGFKSNPHDDQHMKGEKGDEFDDLLVGGLPENVFDDVIIGFGGDDTLVGQDGEDDLGGGAGDDLLVGAMWTDDDGIVEDTEAATDGNGVVDAADTFAQDDFSDDFNAEGTFEENGTDTIWLYDDDVASGSAHDLIDGVYDVIDLSDTLDFEDTDFSGTITDEEKEDQLGVMFTYDDGELQTAGNDAEVWFNVFTDEVMTVADTVYVEVDGDQFMSDGSGWDLVA
jgi:hypothetical protein